MMPREIGTTTATSSGHVHEALRRAGALSSCLAISAFHCPLASQSIQLQEVRRLSATEHTLSVVSVVGASPDGTLWASQPQDGDIVGLRPGESRLVHVGSKGEGPGAFRNVRQLIAVGERIWVLDSDLARGTWFQMDGKLVSTTPIRKPDGLRAPRLLAAGPGGGAWWSARSPQRAIYFAEHDGTGLRRIDEDRPSNCSVGVVTGSVQRSLAIPFCHRELDAFSPDGAFRGMASPLHLEPGYAGVKVVTVSVTGDTVINHTIRVEESIIPERIRDSVTADLARRYQGSLSTAAGQIASDDLVPTTYSPVFDLDLSSRGIAIVTVRRGRGRDKVAYLIHPGGRGAKTVALRPNQDVRWIEGNRLIMVESDEFGLQDVVLYRIQ